MPIWCGRASNLAGRAEGESSGSRKGEYRHKLFHDPDAQTHAVLTAFSVAECGERRHLRLQRRILNVDLRQVHDESVENTENDCSGAVPQRVDQHRSVHAEAVWHSTWGGW